MKKNNNVGFILLETLITSTVVIGVLVFLYVQFSNIKRSYDDSFKINTIPGLYGALDIKKYLNNTGYSTLETALKESDLGYVDVTSSNISGDGLYYEELNNKLNINKILFVKEDMKEFKNFLSDVNNQKSFSDNMGVSTEFFRYVNKIAVSNMDEYRLIIIYNDDTYTSIVLD